ncbi:ribonuclease H-like domain-containing protein [Marinibactrum halimedae]|uniref:Predicted 3'-5' exonuclease PolB-like domain-containing protein n=1 Tax=Marinibactrum halimedae TaxID=1444977 RepID=A0AA37TAC5_9GAMM|nr:ribonuclease H-like domain-containing protein [Marinibactrum halimedae]MCD9458920.1 ribonuclease H-like domain-containing protein [Marinibactrum halimedae]GLS27767.1 hypothetical protein GCM10007877_34860 [Marinibactrum halimedae]
MIVNIDIETIPTQKKGAYETFLLEAQSSFKAPSSLSKKQALEDLGLPPEQQPQKFWTKDDTIKVWENEFASLKAPEVAEENYRRTALDGSKGEIFSIAFAVEDNEPQCIWIDGSHITNEEDLLLAFFDRLKPKTMGRPPYFVGHNIGGFDLRFIYQRCVVNRCPPPFSIPYYGRHSFDYFDTMIDWGGKNRISQDELCKILNIEGKPNDIDGSKVWDFVKEGEGERVAEYNIDDVVKNREIYMRLSFKESISKAPQNTQQNQDFKTNACDNLNLTSANNIKIQL